MKGGGENERTVLVLILAVTIDLYIVYSFNDRGDTLTLCCHWNASESV